MTRPGDVKQERWVPPSMALHMLSSLSQVKEVRAPVLVQAMMWLTSGSAAAAQTLPIASSMGCCGTAMHDA